MEYIPNFRFQSTSDDLILRSSAEAAAMSGQQQGVRPHRPKGAARTLEDAKARVVAGGGDCSDNKLVLSQYEIQFGKYSGQSFHWLLSHDMGYGIMILAAHQQERESGDTGTSPIMQNKDSLSQYARLFPCVAAAVQQRRMADGSLTASSQDGKQVGFGAHAGLTYRELYESADPEVQSYRMWLRKARVQSAGSSMDHLRKYVLGRDQARKADASTCGPVASAAASSSGQAASSAASSSAARASLPGPSPRKAKRSRIIRGTRSS